LIDSSVDTFDALHSPIDKRNVIRHVELFAHVAHHAEESIWLHTEFVTHLSVGEAARKSAQYDCFFAGQNWVQPKSRRALDADDFGFVLHGVTLVRPAACRDAMAKPVKPLKVH
jgi:hypothetical protein